MILFRKKNTKISFSSQTICKNLRERDSSKMKEKYIVMKKSHSKIIFSICRSTMINRYKMPYIKNIILGNFIRSLRKRIQGNFKIINQTNNTIKKISLKENNIKDFPNSFYLNNF